MISSIASVKVQSTRKVSAKAFPRELFNIFLLIFLLISSTAASGAGNAPQEVGTISGTVVDENNKPLSNVNVGLIGTPYGTSTDDKGQFQIDKLQPGMFILGATMLGYDDQSQQVRIREGETTQVNLMLPSRIYTMPQVNVIASKKGIFETVPGSLTYIDQAQIQLINPVSGNEVLRRSPGVHVVDEEGMGMRANIGIRGLDPDRSRSVLILEDGIPVALAPYGEPELYYTPAIDRMAGVEILKGSGSILYGPQTIGGVINYITADPPLEQTGHATIRGAQGGFYTAMVSYGNSTDKAGYNVNFLHKQADSVGISNFKINDLSAKIRLQGGDKSTIALKLGVYDETSNSTYVGITQAMYDAGGAFDFARVSPDDVLAIRRYSAALIHNYFFNNTTRLTTTAYGYTTTRNWQRQDFAYNTFNPEGDLNPPPSNFTGVVWGDETIPGGAIYMRNTTGNRNRQFEVAGAETRLQSDYFINNMKSEFIAGARFLYERAFEQRINGSNGSSSSGSLMEDEIRTGIGSSAFAHNRFSVTQRISVTAGLRLENFSYERDIRRGRFQIGDQVLLRDTTLVAGSSLTQLIPGAGFNILLGGASTLFGGIHRGFAPPRVKDAVSNDGYVYQLDAEKSWNYEMGIRQNTPWGVSWELTGFYMDFANQVIPVSESSGGQGVGLVNGGRTFHRGAEFAVIAEVSQWWQAGPYSVTLDAGLTRVDARFNADRFVGPDNNMLNIRGNKTPYSPEWIANSALVFKHNNGWMARLAVNHVEKQYADILNTETPSTNGRTGIIPAYTVFNGCVAYRIDRISTTFRVSAQNLTDERYIVTRRPQGIRLGLPRMFTAGISVDI